MRVIAGSARRLLLKTPPGYTTRPTSDKIKETLFNILMPYLYDAVFLDLYSGTGGIGIEALSRGAREAVFVENDKKALSCINENIKTTHFENCSKVMAMDAMMALRQLEGKYKFDIIFMDPPYDNSFEEYVLNYLSNSSLIDSDTLIIVEASKETSFDYLETLGFEVTKDKEYKNSRHLFMKMRNSL